MQTRVLRENFHTHEHGTAPMPPWWMTLPAYTVMPFIRRPLGFALVNPLHTLVSLAIVAFLGFMLVLVIPAAALGPLWLTWFACASFVMVCVTFAIRFYGHHHGDRINTHSAGYSHLTWAAPGLPVWICEQVIIPLLLGGAGWIIAHRLSWELGWWLILCGFSYSLMSNWEARKRMALDLIITDNMTRAQVFGDRVDVSQAEAAQPGRAQGSGQSRAGWQGRQASEPEAAELGRHPRRPTGRRAATPPDAARWSGSSDSIQPAYMTWFRRRRG